MEEFFQQLAAPFPVEQVSWRVGEVTKSTPASSRNTPTSMCRMRWFSRGPRRAAAARASASDCSAEASVGSAGVASGECSDTSFLIGAG